MKKSYFLVVMLFSVAVAIVPAHAAEFQDSRLSEKNYREDELIVKFKSTVSESEKENLHNKHGSKKIREFRNLCFHQVKLKKGLSVQEAIELYKSDPNIEFAEPNFKVKALALPNDQYFNFLWGLYNYGQTGGTSGADIKAPQAWDITTGSSNVVVAILDTGIDYTHPDLVANRWVNINEVQGNGIDDDGDGYVDDAFGVNMITGSGDPMDDNGHGTHVAGIIGAAGNNGLGIVGINWNVKMMACKFLGADGTGDVAGAIACLQYIKTKKDAGVNIVASNNSWGCSNCYSQALYDTINAQRDILFVAAAGNDSTDNDRHAFYPAAYDLPNLIAVAATDMNDSRAYFSNYGRRSVHVGAPGDSIYSTLPAQNMWGIAGGYGFLSGTSMAAPHVTGLTALVKSSNTSADWREIKNLILSGGDNTLSMNGVTVTGKRINAHGSLACTHSPLFSILSYPSTLTAGVSTTLSALSINCGSPSGQVFVTLSGGASMVLRDNGIAPDLAAGDGIFTGTWTPSQGAGRLAFSSPAGTETIVIPALTIASSYLTEGNIHTSYSYFLAASGGLPNFTWSISSGSLPPGLTLKKSTGEISGHPTTTGKYYFAARVTDRYGDAASKKLLISVLDDSVPQVWSKTYDKGADDYGQGIAVDASGHVYVTGYTEGASIADYVTLNYDTAGNKLWTKTYDSGSIDRAFDIAVDKSGNSVVTGLSQGSTYDALTIKYDASGNVLWARTFDQGFDEIARAVAIDGSGNVYITGYSDNGSNRDYLTVKYDTAGNVVWARIYDAGADELPYGIAVDTSGNVYVTGLTFSSWPTSDFLTVKYDPSGNVLWAKTYDAATTDWARGIAVDNSGNAYVTGDSGEGGLTPNILTIKYDPSGNVLWSKTYAADNSHSYRITLDNNSNSYVIGDFLNESFRACLIIKYDPSGNVLWTKTLDSGSTNFAGSIAVDPNNMVYVTGYIQNGTDYDFLTVKYQQSAGDFTPPTGSITINSGKRYAYSTWVSLSLSCSDVSGSRCAKMQFSNDGLTWSTPKAYAAARSWKLSSGDGTKTVSVTYQDTAGNWSIAYSDDIVFSTKKPNLTIRDVNAPETATLGKTITVSWATVNMGQGIAGPSTTKIYLAKGAALSVNDILLGSVSIPELDAGARISSTIPVVIPPNIRTGGYYLIITADADKTIPETNESNNKSTKYIRVKQ